MWLTGAARQQDKQGRLQCDESANMREIKKALKNKHSLRCLAFSMGRRTLQLSEILTQNNTYRQLLRRTCTLLGLF